MSGFWTSMSPLSDVLALYIWNWKAGNYFSTASYFQCVLWCVCVYITLKKNFISQIYPLANKTLQTYVFILKKSICPPLSNFIVIQFVRETNVSIVLDLNVDISYKYTYFKKCCRGGRRMSIVERRLNDWKEMWALNIIYIHKVTTFDAES